MHYTPGFIAFGGVFSIVSAHQSRHLFPLAGFLLDTAGALFGLYLVLAAGLGIAGAVLRHRDRRSPTVRVPASAEPASAEQVPASAELVPASGEPAR